MPVRSGMWASAGLLGLVLGGIPLPLVLCASLEPEAVQELFTYGSLTNRTRPGTNFQVQRSLTAGPKGAADECRLVMNQSVERRCTFVQNTPDCSQDDGFIDYLQGVFCHFQPQLLPLAILLDVFWLLFLFMALGITASKFFCPNLSAISTSLRLTHNVAGVTFLAFGNGAPDVFSAVAAFTHPRTAGLAIGALFGAGIFVTTVVAGSVALVKPFTVASRPFLRDVVFYMVAVFWTFLILFRGRISLGESLGYLSLYLVYVFTVIVSAYIYNRQKQRLNGPLQNGTPGPDLVSDSDEEIPNFLNQNIQDCENEYQPLLLPYIESTSDILLSSLNPVDSRKWRRKRWYWRAAKVFKVPLEVLLLLTVPVVDPDKEDRDWKRPLNCLHLVTGPLVCVLTFKSGEYGLHYIEGEFPVWALVLLVGLFLAAIVFCTTSNQQPPRYHFLFSLLGFVVSAMWINAAATEVVSLLRAVGVIFNLSNTVLGLTLLAWGNSIGDCFSDITIAHQGYPRMAISACFGGIIFNMLFGVGLGCLVQMLHNHQPVKLEAEGLLGWELAGALGLSLVCSFILVPLQCFHLSRVYGVFLLLFYVAFLLVALLTEFGEIRLGGA
uniref:Solute carrier family 8 member B1 n=1 Tax=Lepisosteus oculatus TaxID=7918 RepID=W5MPF1_LEPOC|nr:PREDICTED: sodium/potassium/calcium exchanger 6, mitochondrial [Lepisosteus oculatus]